MGLALAGLAAAVAIGLLANSITGDSVGLSAEPLSAGDALAPPAAERSEPQRERRADRAERRRRTAPAATSPSRPPPSDAAPPPAAGDDGGVETDGDDGGQGRGRGRSGGDSGSEDSGSGLDGSGSGSDDSGSGSDDSGSGSDDRGSGGHGSDDAPRARPAPANPACVLDLLLDKTAGPYPVRPRSSALTPGRSPSTGTRSGAAAITNAGPADRDPPPLSRRVATFAHYTPNA